MPSSHARDACNRIATTSSLRRSLGCPCCQLAGERALAQQQVLEAQTSYSMAVITELVNSRGTTCLRADISVRNPSCDGTWWAALAMDMILHAVKGFALEFLTVFQVLDSGLGLEPIWLTHANAMPCFPFHFPIQKSHPWSTCMRPFIPPAQRSGRDVSGRLRPTSAAQAAWPATLPTSCARWLGPRGPHFSFSSDRRELQVTKQSIYINI